jgi:hypothetical protein
MKHWRFPIGLLAIEPDDPKRTLDLITSWCLWDVGDTDGAKEISDERALDHAQEHRWPTPESDAEFRVTRGAMVLGCSPGSLDANIRADEQARAFLNHAGTAARTFVNVSADWLWRAFYTAREDRRRLESTRPLAWRDFRILCALLSKVGRDGLKKCGWREIQARAAGWAGKRQFEEESKSERERRAKLILSPKEIRTTLDKMEANKFFLRIRYGQGNRGGESWFSFSLSREEAAEKIVGMKANSREKRLAEMRKADAELLALALSNRRQSEGKH